MNMKMASILCLVIMLAGCVAGQQRGLVGDTYVSFSQPALALKARDLPLMGSMTGASRLTSSGAMGGLLVDSWVTVYGKGDGASPLAIVAHGEVPNGWYWDGIMRHPFSINEGVETIGGVRIMFSPAGTSADKVIEKLAHDARVRNVETMVVTSDATIQDTVFGGGIDRMSANGFSREVGMYYEDVHLDETPKVALKRTLGDRIKPDVLEKLKAMRDGA